MFNDSSRVLSHAGRPSTSWYKPLLKQKAGQHDVMSAPGTEEVCRAGCTTVAGRAAGSTMRGAGITTGATGVAPRISESLRWGPPSWILYLIGPS